MTKNKKNKKNKKKKRYTGLTNLPPTIQTCVNFRNFAEQYLRSLKTYHFQITRFY